MQPSNSILIVDFGSQVTQLIARRVREAGVYCEIAPFSLAWAAYERMKPRGTILSGLPPAFRKKAALGRRSNCSRPGFRFSASATASR